MTSEDTHRRKLDSQLVGAYLGRRTCLCQIAPNSRWQATLWVDQRHRQYLSAGQPVTVRLEAFPGTDLTGKIQSVGAANELKVPAVITTRLGGPFLTKSTAAGEIPTEPVYSALIVLDNVECPVQSGMRGMGRFARPAMTVGSWLLDELHRVFVVR